MKIELFDGIEMEINTAYEQSIMYWFLISRYGSMYKAVKMGGLIITREETDADDENGHYTIENANDNKRYNDIIMPLTEAAENFKKQLNGICLDCNNEGEYVAIDFKGHLLTTVEYGGRTHAAMFPASMFQENATKDTEHFYVSNAIYPTIVSEAWDEACDHCYNYRLRFSALDCGDIMYEVDVANPIDSEAYVI